MLLATKCQLQKERVDRNSYWIGDLSKGSKWLWGNYAANKVNTENEMICLYMVVDSGATTFERLLNTNKAMASEFINWISQYVTIVVKSKLLSSVSSRVIVSNKIKRRGLLIYCSIVPPRADCYSSPDAGRILNGCAKRHTIVIIDG